MSVSLREDIAKMLWVSGNGGSEIGYLTSHQFVKKTGSNYVLADQILALIGKCGKPEEKKYRKVTREELQALFNERANNCKNSNFQEVYDRIAYNFLQIDGSWELPNSFEGDIFKIFLAGFLFATPTFSGEQNSLCDKPTGTLGEQKEYCKCKEPILQTYPHTNPPFCSECGHFIKPIPAEKECEHEWVEVTWVDTSLKLPPRQVMRCKFCGEIRQIPEPKPKERIEELDGRKELDFRWSVTDKINEIIHFINNRKENGE